MGVFVLLLLLCVNCIYSFKLQYEVGKEYLYDYTTQHVQTGNQKTTVGSRSTRLTSEIILAAQREDEEGSIVFEMNMRKTKLTERSGDSAAYQKTEMSEEISLALAHYPAQFALKSNGQIAGVAFSDDDEKWVVNMKRGVMSALQTLIYNHDESDHEIYNVKRDDSGATKYSTRELDVLGHCEALFITGDGVMPKYMSVKRSKDLTNCRARTARTRTMYPRNTPDSLQGLENQVLSFVEVEHLIHKDTKVIDKVQYREKYSFDPTHDASGDVGFVIETGGILRLRQVSEIHSEKSKRFVAKPLTNSLAFEYDDEESAHINMARKRDEEDKMNNETVILTQLNEILEDIVYLHERPRDYGDRLMVIVKKLRDGPDGLYMKRLKVKIVDELLPESLRAVIISCFAATDIPVAFDILSTTVLLNPEVSKGLKFTAVRSISHMTNIEEYMIMEMQKYVDFFNGGNVEIQAGLSVGAMIWTYTQKNPLTNDIEGVVAEMEDSLLYATDPDTQITILRALGNAGQSRSLPAIMTLMKSEGVEESILAIAIHATRKMDLSTEVYGETVEKVLWELFEDTWRSQKLRFAAFQALWRNNDNVEQKVERVLNFLKTSEVDKVMYASVIEHFKTLAGKNSAIMGQLTLMKNITNIWIDHQLINVREVVSDKERGIIQEVLANEFGKPLELMIGFCKEKSYGIGDKKFGASFGAKACDFAWGYWPFFGIPKVDLVINNYLKLEAHVLTFQYDFLDVGIDFQARNFKKPSGASGKPLKSATSWANPACPTELSFNCGLGKCAANPVECGLIRISAGLQELDFLVSQFKLNCTRNSPTANATKCEKIYSDANLNWLPKHMKNNLYAWCNASLSDTDMMNGDANQCVRHNVLTAIEELKATLATKASQIQEDFDDANELLDNIDGMLPPQFQNGFAYKAAKEVVLWKYRISLYFEIAPKVITKFREAYKTCCCASDPSFMAAFIGYTTFSKDPKTDNDWRKFIGGYAQISAVCEDGQGAFLLPTLRKDVVWFVFKNEDMLGDVFDEDHKPPDDGKYYHLFPDKPKYSDKRGMNEERFSGLDNVVDILEKICFEIPIPVPANPLVDIDLFNFDHSIPIYAGITLDIHVGSSLSCSVGFAVDVCPFAFTGSAEVFPNAVINVDASVSISFFLVRAGVLIELALFDTTLFLKATVNLKMQAWPLKLGLELARDTKPLTAQVSLFVQIRLCFKMCGWFPCLKWCDEKKWPLGGGWSVGNTGKVVIFTTDDNKENKLPYLSGSGKRTDISTFSIIVDEDIPSPVTSVPILDDDSDPLRIRISALGNGSVRFFGNDFRYTPPLYFSGKDNFTVVANDGKQDSFEVKVDVTIRPIATQPHLLTARSTGDQDTFVKIQLFGERVDNDGSETLNFVLCNCGAALNDTDGDRIPDVCDSCPKIYNPTQENSYCPPCPTSLVGWWTFDSRPDNNIYDNTVLANNGVNYAAKYVVGRWSSGLQFLNDPIIIGRNAIPAGADATSHSKRGPQDSYVRITDGPKGSLRVSGRMSISLFAKIPAYSSVNLLSKYYSYTSCALNADCGWILTAVTNGQYLNVSYGRIVHKRAAGTFAYDYDAYVAQAEVRNVAYSPNNWVHIVVTLSEANHKMYINGQPAITYAYYDPYSGARPSSANLTIGIGVFEGILDQIMIFNKSLLPAEVQELYNFGRLEDYCYNKGNYSACCDTQANCRNIPYGTVIKPYECHQYVEDKPCSNVKCTPVIIGRKRNHKPPGLTFDISEQLCCMGLKLPPGAAIYVNKTTLVTNPSHINEWDARHLYLKLANGTFGNLCLTVSAITTEKLPTKDDAKYRQAFVSKNVGIVVFPVNGPPEINSTNITITAGAPIANLSAVIVDDDALNGTLKVFVSWPAALSLYPAYNLGDYFITQTPNTTSLIIEGPIDQVNFAIANIKIVSTTTGVFPVTVTVHDQGNSGRAYVNHITTKQIYVTVTACPPKPYVTFAKSAYNATSASATTWSVDISATLSTIGNVTLSPSTLITLTVNTSVGTYVMNAAATYNVIYASSTNFKTATITCTPENCSLAISLIKYTYSSSSIFVVCDKYLGAIVSITAELGSSSITTTTWISFNTNPTLQIQSTKPIINIPSDSLYYFYYWYNKINENTPSPVFSISLANSSADPNSCTNGLAMKSLVVDVKITPSVGNLYLKTVTSVIVLSGYPLSPDNTAIHLRGRVADVNAALATLAFRHPLSFLGASNLLFDVKTDHGISANKTFTFYAPYVFETRPVVTQPGYIFVDEYSAYYINLLGVLADTDTSVRLATQVGKLYLTNTTALTWYGGVNNSPLIYIAGTPSVLKNALRTLYYYAPLDYFGPDTLTTWAQDYWYWSTASSRITQIEVIPAAQIPLVSVGATLSGYEDIATAFAITITPGSSKEKVYIEIVLPPQARLSNGSFDGQTWSLSPPELVGLQLITKENYNGNFTAVVTGFEIEPQNGDTKTVVRSVAVIINAANDPPELKTPAQLYAVEEQALLVNPFIEVTDLDLPDGVGGYFYLWVECYSCELFLDNDVQFSFGSYYEQFGTLEAINANLKLLSYLGNENFTGVDSLLVYVSDQGSVGVSPYNSASYAYEWIKVNVKNTNDQPYFSSEPVNVSATTYPCDLYGLQTTCKLIANGYEDSALSISGLQIYDFDPNDVFEVELAAANGAITLTASTVGLTFQDYDPSSTSSGDQKSGIVFTGSLVNVNRVLQSFTYTPYLNANNLNIKDYAGSYPCTDNVTVTVRDSSSFIQAQYQLNIYAINDCPSVVVNQIPQEITLVTPDIPVVIYGVYLFDDYTEIPGSYATLTVEVRGGGGTLTINAPLTGIEFIEGTGVNDVKFTIKGSPDALNNTLTAPWMWINDAEYPHGDLTGIWFTPSKHFIGNTEIWFTVNDNGYSSYYSYLNYGCSNSTNVTLSIADAETVCDPFCGTCCAGWCYESIVGWWRLDYSSTTTILDHTQFNNDGTFTNGAYDLGKVHTGAKFYNSYPIIGKRDDDVIDKRDDDVIDKRDDDASVSATQQREVEEDVHSNSERAPTYTVLRVVDGYPTYSLRYNGAVTISMWVKFPSYANVILMKKTKASTCATNTQCGWFIQAYLNGQTIVATFYQQIYSSPAVGVTLIKLAEGTATLSYNRWAHFTIIIGSVHKVYIDGKDVTTTSSFTYTYPGLTDGPLTFGEGDFYDGIIDHVLWLNKTLTAAEVTYLYENNKPKETCYSTAKSCKVKSYGDCKDVGGTFVAGESSCAGVACTPQDPKDFGACCIPGNDRNPLDTCADLLNDAGGKNYLACARVNGTWSPGTICKSKFECPCDGKDNIAACCTIDTCINVENSDLGKKYCSAQRGIKFSPGQSCVLAERQNVLTCPSKGSCCYQGLCYDEYDKDVCARLPGGVHSPHTTCKNDSKCTAGIFGACCYNSSATVTTCVDGVCSATTQNVQTCDQLSQRECGQKAGRFGRETTCARFQCPNAPGTVTPIEVCGGQTCPNGHKCCSRACYNPKEFKCCSNGVQPLKLRQRFDTTENITATIRDLPSTNPDVERSGYGIDRGIAKVDLDAERKPVYSFSGASINGTITTPANFYNFFHDSSSTKNLGSFGLTLYQIGGATSPVYSYSNTSLFPIDRLGYGNLPGLAHNYHWCIEIHETFGYRGNEVIEVCSDDDAWLFLNNRLVIDLGGVHLRECASVPLNSIANSIGIEKNNNYNFDLFYCERKTHMSVLSFSKPYKIDPVCTTA